MTTPISNSERTSPPTSALAPRRERRAEAAAPPEGPPRDTAERAPNDRILHLGMGASCAHEAESLRRAGATVEPAVSTRGNGTIVYQGQTFELDRAEGVRAFVRALGLPDGTAREVERVIVEVYLPDARAALAILAAAWAPAERGGVIPSRLALSGHASGYTMWGDRDLSLELPDFARLALAMPRAAGQIEDLMLHGCHTGGAGRVERWRALLPNLKTVWAYADSAPGSHNGAVPHFLAWERATRGRAEVLSPDAARDHRKGHHVSTWSSAEGYRPGRLEAEQERRLERRGSWDGPLAAYASGEREVSDPSQGELREHYAHLQGVLGRVDLDPAVETHVVEKAGLALRLLYYRKKVAPAFAAAYASELRAGYASLGLSPPRFEALSRKQALQEIARFEAAYRARPPGERPAAAQALEPLLSRGLRDLRPDLIPERWI